MIVHVRSLAMYMCQRYNLVFLYRDTMKNALKLPGWIACVLLVTCSLQAVENSIIAAMEKYKNTENLSPQKYSQKQFKDIKNALDHKDHSIRVATYNMLFNLYDENLAPENRWPARLPRILQLLQDMDADVIGTQELQPDQVRDLIPLIENTYSFFSINTPGGEQDGILFKKDRFTVLKQKAMFMGSTDATLTTVELQDLQTGKAVTYCNAHFAFFNIEERNFQAHFVAKTVRSIAKTMPVVFMGDLNTFPNRPDMSFPAFDGSYISQILSKKILKDSSTVSKLGHVGPIATFTNQDGISPPAPFQATGTPGVFLDHIYVTKDIIVLIHAVQPGTVDGHFPSDHMPVIIDMVVP